MNGSGAPPPAPPAPSAQQNAGSAPSIPYIGSRISLISKTDIRYEGFLFNIDTRQSMVALQHVRSFGTEGRRPEHIPPSDTVLPYATFKASEIKDLHVCEAAPPPMPPPPPPMPSQPHPNAPVAPAQPPQNQPPAPPSPPAQPPRPVAPATAPAPVQQPSPKAPKAPTLLTPGSISSATAAPPHVEPVTNAQPSQASNGSHQTASRNPRTTPGMGGHLLKRKERRVPGSSDPAANDVAKSSEFNFEEGLNEFDKEKEFEKLTVSEMKGSYQKSSFFDTISCDALDRLEGKKGRLSASDERKLNTETFGAVGLNNRRNYRGGRGGRRGGRGGRGGRGRGGNNNWGYRNRSRDVAT